ncbi:MAG: hypothetical protein QXY80_06495, partial [Candidatus Jordarchaeales archaeon]
MAERAAKEAKKAKAAKKAGEEAERVKEAVGKEAVAAPKFKQPWDGLLSFFTFFIWAYIVLQVFVHPVWGVATKMVR